MTGTEAPLGPPDAAPAGPNTPTSDPWARRVSLFLGAPTWLVLGIALWLTPAAEGYGTHRQLGLSGCTLLSITGYPCPMCGMTTTFSHMAHAQPLMALRTQPFGVVLFLITAFLAGLALAELILPTGRWRRLLSWIERYELRLAIGLLVGLIGGWIYKILMMKILV